MRTLHRPVRYPLLRRPRTCYLYTAPPRPFRQRSWCAPGSPAQIKSGFDGRYRLRSPNRQTQFSFICLYNRLGVTTTTGRSPELLGDKLAKSDGVLCPPSNVDPAMRAPTPNSDSSNTPVIPPPGSPGGDQSVRPK
ncbi:hypothetical protein [Tardiphaga robiniae]|uniref:hypothetical protein n=1 Tax=Tardiphaga TaxID=1395974 RepID=UPI0035B50D65